MRNFSIAPCSSSGFCVGNKKAVAFKKYLASLFSLPGYANLWNSTTDKIKLKFNLLHGLFWPR